MTHGDLLERAERWLRNTIRCGVVLVEASGSGLEIPDAIGWTAHNSFLVECKVSRADFLADRRKSFRGFGDLGLGLFRYYLTPPGLLRADELPPRWGLLEAQERRVKTMRKALRWKPEATGLHLGMRSEMSILLSELRKIQIVQRGGRLKWSTRATDRVNALVGPGNDT